MMLWIGCLFVHFNTYTLKIFLHLMCFGTQSAIAASTLSYKFSTFCASISLFFIFYLLWGLNDLNDNMVT